MTASRLANASLLLGFGTIATLLAEVDFNPQLAARDWCAIAATVAICCMPRHLNFALGATALAALLSWRNDKRLSSIGQLTFALAWIDYWAPLIYSHTEEWILPLETWLAFIPVGLLTDFSRSGTIIDNGLGHSIMIVEGCSAFRNTMTIAFVWLCLTKLQRLEINSRLIRTLACALIAAVVINSARIAVLSMSPALFEYWHDGFGFTIAKLAMLATVATIFYFGFAPLRLARESSVDRCPQGAPS